MSDYRAELDALSQPLEPDYDKFRDSPTHAIWVAQENRIHALTDLCERVVATLEQRQGYGVLICPICDASFTTTNKMSAHHGLHADHERVVAENERLEVELKSANGRVDSTIALWRDEKVRTNRLGALLDEARTLVDAHVRSHGSPWDGDVHRGLEEWLDRVEAEREHTEPGQST